MLAGKDCLCVMPTGGGKSLCYQLPAIVGSGLTLVVSPLIALMKDQVDQLTARGLPATFINSTLSPEELSRRLERMAAGDFKLVYVVPERFRSPRFLEAVGRCEVRLLAVDEAHCVSEWGHDFRPDYARLGRFRAQLGNPPTIALTATATDAVRRDIVEHAGAARPADLHHRLRPAESVLQRASLSTDRDKDEGLFRFLSENPGSGIVYASTRKRCEALGEKIASRTGRRTSVYHAGLSADDRRAAQDDFMQGRTEIVVATLAFGMGIDKADVRFVVHYNLPGSLEAYYQEAGRAGRDGLPARCLLLFGGGDRHIHEFFIESAYPSRDAVRQVYDFLCALEVNPIEMTQQEVKEALNLQIAGEGVGTCEKLLEKAGALERLEAAENTAAVRLNSDLPTLVDLLPPQAKVKRQVLRAVEQLVGGQRREWYYFQPRELLRGLSEMDSTTLSRNLRELAALAAVDYVPPFRGRAIHLVERGRPFEELEIDFDTLEEHKAAEYERLEHLIRFAKSLSCRQQVILTYFGETDSPPCDHCDNCREPSQQPGSGEASRAVVGPVLDALRMVLSGVARVRRGCGKQLLAQMLCGSKSQKVVRNRLDKLSTFGLLAHLTQPEVVKLTEALLRSKLLEETEIEPFRPVLQLTPLGSEVMSGRGTAGLVIVLPEYLWSKLNRDSSGRPADAASGEQGGGLAPADPAVVERLRKWREVTSRAQAVPAYVVMSNAVLDELARARPRDVESLLGIKGIGPAKVKQYGEALLGMLADATSESPAANKIPATSETPAAIENPVASEIPADEVPVAPPAISPETQLEDARPNHYWTWRLLAAGFTPEECAAIRGLAAEVVLDHALRAADGGLRVDAAWFLAPEQIQRIEEVVGPAEPSRIRSLLEHLPRGTRYEEVQLVLKARRRIRPQS